MTYTEFVHEIWIERNSRIFEKTESTEIVIAKKVACLCCVRATPFGKTLLDSYRF